MRDKDFEEYKSLIEKAIEIVYYLGHSLYKDGIYKEEYCGKVFDYDKFSIRLHDTDNKKNDDGVDIRVNNIYVLNYYFGDNIVSVRDGKWEELVNVLYDNLTLLLEERNRAVEETNLKVEELLSLRDYFDFYVYSNKNNEKVLNYINRELARYKIEVSKEDNETPIVNGDVCDYYSSPNFSVVSNGQEVAQFKDSDYDVFPNIEYYMSKFVPGTWTNNYKRIILKSMDYDDILLREKLDYTADTIIKSLKK